MNILTRLKTLLVVCLFGMSASSFGATITTSTTTAGVGCDLINAILAMNSGADNADCTADLVPADAYGTNDTIILSGATYSYAAGYMGTLTATPVIEKSLVIQGDPSTLDATADGFRLIEIAPLAPATIQVELVEMTLTGGKVVAHGGGIKAVDVDLILDEVSILDNSAVNGRGAGLFIAEDQADSTLDVINSDISRNHTNFSGGGIYVGEDVDSVTLSDGTMIDSNVSGFRGGGLRHQRAGTLTITDSFIRNNDAQQGGGIYVFESGTTDISNTVIDNNTSMFSGGGIHYEASETLNILDSSAITNNVTESNGGGLNSRLVDADVNISSSTIEGNSADSDGGGVHHVFSSTLMITDSIIRANTAKGDGGGLSLFANSPEASIINSEISGNEAITDPDGFGGGIFNSGSDYDLINSTVSGNTARIGAALYVEDSSVDILHSTLSGNHANNTAGTIRMEDESTGTITNSTLSGNTADLLAGGSIIIDSTLTIENTTITTADPEVMEPREAPALVLVDSGVDLYSSIVAIGIDEDPMNLDPETFDCWVVAGAPVVSNDFNIDTDGTCLAIPEANDKDNETLAAIDLGLLQDNGGVGMGTETHALLENSIALDMGDCAVSGITDDQRFLPRPSGAACDIGAYEEQIADEDGDGILDPDDVCPGTIFPEQSIVSGKLRTNRWALDVGVEDPSIFVTVDPNGVGPENEFTKEQTQGCSCEDIVALSGGDALLCYGEQLGKGHLKNGCSISAMETFIFDYLPTLNCQ